MTSTIDITDALTAVPDGFDVRDVEQFLYREARYADESDYDSWEALWTDDALYWVPAGNDSVDPMESMSVVYDNRNRIATRLKQLRTGRRYAQARPSNLRRTISNIELLGGRATSVGGTDLEVGANFLVLESRARGNHLWGGRVTYRLRRVEGTLRMSYKKVVLVDKDKPIPTMGFLILMTVEFGEGVPVDVPGIGPVVESEFAQVSVNIDNEGNSPRLRLEDLRTGRVRYLDALELETVIWLPAGKLAQLLDPSADRWRGDE